MISEAPGAISFTVFLTLMAEKLTGTDPEHVIMNAFSEFDDGRTGTIDAEYLRECMTTMGDRFTDEEVSSICTDRALSHTHTHKSTDMHGSGGYYVQGLAC